MPTTLDASLSNDLNILMGHFRVQPSFEPAHHAGMIGWAAMGGHYLVSSPY